MLVFAGGGTGGHLYPALAIADEVRKQAAGARVIFVGTKDKIEARVVPERGYTFVPIWIAGFRRRVRWDSLAFPIKVLVALYQSMMILKRERPDVVVGTGGYVCAPVGLAAALLGVPLVVQEQNSVPGMTIRMLAKKAQEVHLTFASSKRYLRRTDNVVLSGNPTRAEIGQPSRAEGAAYFGFDAGRKTLFIFGGSLGASSLNRAVIGMIGDLMTLGVQVLWQTGKQDYDLVRRTLQEHHPGMPAKAFPYIDRMEYGYAACDLALCRAGASTIAELTISGTPAVLVPYPHAAADHQTENANTMVEAGAAVLCRDADLQPRLAGLLRELVADPDRLLRMAHSARSLGRPDAAASIARAVITIVRRRHAGA